jgi:hypothetical protein
MFIRSGHVAMEHNVLQISEGKDLETKILILK